MTSFGINLGFKLPVSSEEAEENEELQGFMALTALTVGKQFDPEDKDQTVLVVLDYCGVPDCPLKFPHRLQRIESERPLSDNFLVNFDRLIRESGMPMTIVQNGNVITFKEHASVP